MPRERYFAATRMRTILPSTTARTFCTLGLKVRFVQDVIFSPTPPFCLARPRLVNWRPAWVFLPLIWQTRAMTVSAGTEVERSRVGRFARSTTRGAGAPRRAPRAPRIRPRGGPLGTGPKDPRRVTWACRSPLQCDPDVRAVFQHRGRHGVAGSPRRGPQSRAARR